MDKSYGSIQFVRLKRAIDQIEQQGKSNGLSSEEIDNLTITFEYLVGSFFPDVVKNVHDEANKQYTAGYIAGRKSLINDN